MTGDPRVTGRAKPQSSRYRCLIEELEKSRHVLHMIEGRVREQNNTLNEILWAIERLIDGTIGAKAGSGPDQQNPVGMEADKVVVAVPGEAGIGSQSPTLVALQGVEAGDVDPPRTVGAKSEIREDKDSVSQREAAEKARRIRHGEGLDLDEPQF